MTIYICDDEQTILNMTSDTIRSYMPADNITGFTSGMELMMRLQNDMCDILFLDIDMPDLNGMEIAGRLAAMEHKPLLVFVTSHDELVYESMQYHPFGFIRKSYFHEEIEKVLADCKEEIAGRNKHFCFKETGQNVKLLLSDILYFEADGNYLKLITPSKTYRFRSTISAVENSLQSCGFIRSHKGFLVNEQAVKVLGKDELRLTDGTLIPIGKSYSEETKKQLLSYMRM